jgi:hypothetical protein
MNNNDDNKRPRNNFDFKLERHPVQSLRTLTTIVLETRTILRRINNALNLISYTHGYADHYWFNWRARILTYDC